MADACIHLMNFLDAPELYDGMRVSHINIGTGEDLSIGELATLICEVVDYSGKLYYDTSKPDGTPRKLLDVSRLNESGWRHSISLREGIIRTYKWFLSSESIRR